MLLLVLILVVIAFGLLVVALLTGSVLWAWVSVGVSVVAAVVLLIDWLQRRSAVRAGAVAPVSTPPARPAPAVDLDPATEILPVVPASGRRESGSEGSTADRTERVQDAQQTVVMPVVQPSGSSARPPGAEATITSSGGISSPSVTKPGAEPSRPTAPGDGADDVTRTTARPPAAASGDTISISKDSLPRGAVPAPDVSGAPSSEAGEPDAATSGAAGSAAPGASLSKPPKGDASGPAESDVTAVVRKPAEATEAVEPGGTSEPDDDDPAAATAVVRGPAAAGAAQPESERTIVTSLPAAMGSRPEPVAEAPKSPAEETVRVDLAAARGQDRSSDVEKTVKVQARTPKKPAGEDEAPASTPPPSQSDPARSSAPVQAPPAESPTPEPPTVVSTPEAAPADAAPPAEQATVVPSAPAERPPARKDVDLFAPAAQPATSVEGPPPPEPPPGPLGDAPEEQSDPIAAEIVSGLDDEVVVVDEQPRYHVTTCAALVSTAVIPLPVREAVELGFTPCGWCSPERTLSGRHRSAAR